MSEKTDPVMWDYFDKFSSINDNYLPSQGDGDSVATQIVTVVNKLIYKWYNDGDVFDNTYMMSGWLNDLSSYANWMYKNIIITRPILDKIKTASCDEDYEHLLKELADKTLNEEFLNQYKDLPKIGSVYDCDGPYEFVEETDEDEDESWH